MLGLILEGGGMRGAFTAGVLDYWMSRGLWFQNVYGVSAGACQACSYLCRQPGRGLRVWVNYTDDPRFISLRSLITTGDMIGAELNYDLVPRKLDPLDNAAFLSSGARFTAVLTDVETGKPVYVPIRDMFEDIDAVRASASLPLVSRMVVYRGRRYLDGGVSDSIPIRRAIADGCDRNVLVLTQAPGYRKEPNKALPLMKVIEKVLAGEIVYPEETPVLSIGNASSDEFTPRELDVLRKVVYGYTDQEIADLLNMSRWTVRTHVKSLMQKTGFKNRVELAVNVRSSGLVIDE